MIKRLFPVIYFNWYTLYLEGGRTKVISAMSMNHAQLRADASYPDWIAISEQTRIFVR